MEEKPSEQDLIEMINRHISLKENSIKRSETLRDSLMKKYPDGNYPDTIKNAMNLLSGLI